MSPLAQFLTQLGLTLAALPLFGASLYLLALTLLARRPAPPTPPQPPTLRFDLIVPAHDEAAGIVETVKSLTAVDYPAALRRLIVVADNCADATAALARAAGARVIERNDAERRGKGYALAFAFERSLADGFADAVVVIDADTIASANLLHAFAARLAGGASAAQAHYGVRNPASSWRTRLMAIALALFHRQRSLGRERLGVSCGLRGNGMCLRTSLLREVPYAAYSLVEDLEYGIRLGRAGRRVAYASEAEVLGEMVSSEGASRSQRRRWEHGRALMAHAHGWPLLRDGLRGRDALLLDLALDVLVPPLAQLVGWALAGAVLMAGLQWWAGIGGGAAAVSALSLGCLGIYVLGGWWHSGTGARGLLDLALSPAYVAWKFGLLIRRPGARKPLAWVRTPREGVTRP